MRHSPTRVAERLLMIDALRGAALWGIFLVNITAMGDSWYQNFPRDPQSLSSPSWIIWIITQLFFKDTMRALFSLLFGAGILLMDARGMETKIFLKRNIFLVIFGLMHGTVLLWGYEVLFVYGISALICFLLRKSTPRKLLLWSALLMLVFSLFSAAGGVRNVIIYQEAKLALERESEGMELNDEQELSIQKWKKQQNNRKPALSHWEKEYETRLGGYVENFNLSTEQFYTFQIGGAKSIFILLETVATIILGMWLFSVNIINGKRDTALYSKLALYGYGIGLPMRAMITYGIWKAGMIIPIGYDLIFYELARISTTLGHIGLFAILFIKFPGRTIWQWFAKMGQMALTNYIGQSILAGIMFFGFGFGLFGQLSWFGLTVLGVVILVSQSIFSQYWLDRYRFGPLEWFWRSLTYGKVQEIQK